MLIDGRRSVDMRRSAGLTIVIFLFMVSAAQLGAAADPKKDLENTLHRFYDAYVQSKWSTAAQYVDPESRPVFLSQSKPGILKYEIRSIVLKNNGQGALVTVGVDQTVQMAGGVITLNAQTEWRLARGKWYLYITAPPPLPASMKAAVKPTSDRPTSDLLFDYREFDFGIKRQGDVVSIEFPFKNATDHPIQVSASLVSLCNCIQVGVTKDTVAPGEKAAVWFKLKSDEFSFYYHQGIGVSVTPGDGTAILDITGFLNPADQNPPSVTK